ncbi:hypothetical protein CN694_26400 [Bacillus wiedmannii]|uniref:Uncharacterized protein n=1 Tax=Bacillus wiedmannii TaxID=1890302 RepID=A0AB73SK59_9BACI|nr:hypothetical protein CN694_26400 [Bacillus wiedmannii]
MNIVNSCAPSPFLLSLLPLGLDLGICPGKRSFAYLYKFYNEAYQNAQFLKGTRNTNIGKSMNRLQIQMCLDKSTGRIISAFLIY